MRRKDYLLILGAMLLAIYSCKDDDGQPQPQIPTQGLLAYFSLDGDANDLSSNGFNGVVNNTAAASSRNGTAGAALGFNGTDSNVSLGDILDDQFTGDRAFSMSFWIYSNGSSSNKILISKLADSGCGEDQRQFALRLVDDKINGLFFYSLSSQTFRRWAGTTLISPGTWYHIVFNYNPSFIDDDGLERLKVYINGNEEVLSLDGTSGLLGEIQDGTAHLGLGNRLNSNGENCATDLVFDGRLDDLRIYNRELTPDEVVILSQE